MCSDKKNSGLIFRFSGGPVSQNDTIELRGFDDADRPGKKKNSPSQLKRAKEWSKKKEAALQNASNPDKDDDDKKASSSKECSTTSESKVSLYCSN